MEKKVGEYLSGKKKSKQSEKCGKKKFIHMRKIRGEKGEVN